MSRQTEQAVMAYWTSERWVRALGYSVHPVLIGMLDAYDAPREAVWRIGAPERQNRPCTGGDVLVVTLDEEVVRVGKAPLRMTDALAPPPRDAYCTLDPPTRDQYLRACEAELFFAAFAPKLRVLDLGVPTWPMVVRHLHGVPLGGVQIHTGHLVHVDEMTPRGQDVRVSDAWPLSHGHEGVNPQALPGAAVPSSEPTRSTPEIPRGHAARVFRQGQPRYPLPAGMEDAVYAAMSEAYARTMSEFCCIYTGVSAEEMAVAAPRLSLVRLQGRIGEVIEEQYRAVEKTLLAAGPWHAGELLVSGPLRDFLTPTSVTADDATLRRVSEHLERSAGYRPPSGHPASPSQGARSLPVVFRYDPLERQPVWTRYLNGYVYRAESLGQALHDFGLSFVTLRTVEDPDHVGGRVLAIELHGHAGRPL